MIVYVATGPTGKRYVGITIATLEKRKREHQREAEKGRDYKFYRAIRKYGFDAFRWEVVQRCESVDSLKAAEIRWIEVLGTRRKGYNTTLGGQGVAGRKMTDKQRAEHGERQRRRFQKPGQREIISNAVRSWKQRDPLGYEVALATRVNTLRTPEYRVRASQKAKQFAEQNPAAILENAARQRARMANNSNRLAISRALGGTQIEATKNGQTFIFETLMEAARELGLSSGNIGMVLSGRRSHTGGYTFRRIGTEVSRTHSADFESRDCNALADSAVCGFGWASLARVSMSQSAQMLESTG